MECRGKFKFKGMRKKSGGEFINGQGQKIEYPASYQLVLDEQTEDGIFERIFKLSMESDLIEPLLIVKPYTDIELEFKVEFYASGVRVIPIALVK